MKGKDSLSALDSFLGKSLNKHSPKSLRGSLEKKKRKISSKQDFLILLSLLFFSITFKPRDENHVFLHSGGIAKLLLKSFLRCF